MKRKLFLGTAAMSALLATGAMGQVVNFHDAVNGTINYNWTGGYYSYYDSLFAGQGAYADPGNNIWNGFGYTPGFSSLYFYTSDAGTGTGAWPQQAGNPGNPYAAYYLYSTYCRYVSYTYVCYGPGWVTSTGPSLFDQVTGTPRSTGNCDSSGKITPITFTVGGYDGDFGVDILLDDGILSPYPNGSPAFLLANSAWTTGEEVFTLGNVPPGTYGLFLYSGNFYNNTGTLFSLNSGSPHEGIAATLMANNGQPPQSFVEGQNFVIFENVTPDDNGNITITADPNPADGVGNTNYAGQSDFDGVQLVFNPPPTAVLPTVAQNVYAGGTASFAFSPAFGTDYTYMWQSIIGGVTNILSNGPHISGATTTNLSITSVSSANVGLYQCVISTPTATNASPPAVLTLLTSTLVNVLQPGDVMTDFNNISNTPPINSVPPIFLMGDNAVEDGTLGQYVNLGLNGSVAPFSGPVGFIVSPNAGPSIVKAMRIFNAGTRPEDDPVDFLLEGSTNGGSTFKTITGGLLHPPAQRNAAGGPINITNQVLQEIDFANTSVYTTYRMTFTNVENDTLASNGVQVAEIELLGDILPKIVVPSTVTADAGGTAAIVAVVTGTPPLTNQWYYLNSSGTPVLIPGATNTTLNLAGSNTLAYENNNYQGYDLVVANPYGASTSSVVTLTLYSGFPVIQTDISPLLTLVPAGVPVTFSVTAVGTLPFTYYWFKGSSVISGAADSSYTFNALAGTNTYSVTVSNSFGPTPSSTATVVGLTNVPPVIVFGDSGSNWSLNFGNNITPSITNDVLTLTDGIVDESSSAFYEIPQYIGGFVASFTYQGTGPAPLADGITFCMQNDPSGAAATGATGGDLGYYGILPSAAFEINLFTGANGGSGIQLGSEGSTPDSVDPTAFYAGTGNVSLTSGDPIYVQLYYGQNILKVSLTDATAGTSFTTNYTTNLEALAGGSSAFIGFTGGDGSDSSTQTVSNFEFSYSTPPMLSDARGTAAGTVVVSWPISISTMYVLQQSPSLKGTWSNVNVTPQIVNGQNQVMLTPGGSPTFYRLDLP
jgi:hypothetical protein